MDLLFADAARRRPCDYEVSVNGMLMPCTFSTSKIANIPAGLRFASGKFELSEDQPASTIYICKNHENRLRLAFAGLLDSTQT